MKYRKNTLRRKSRNLKKHKHKYRNKNTKKYRRKLSHKKKHYTNSRYSRKKHYRKNMRGGTAPFVIPVNTNTNNVQSVPIGSGQFSQSSYTQSDTPSAPPSIVSYTPAVLNNLKWNTESSIKNFINELVGQPKQYGASPTEQPIADKITFAQANPITANQLNDFKQNVISQFSNS